MIKIMERAASRRLKNETKLLHIRFVLRKNERICIVSYTKLLISLEIKSFSVINCQYKKDKLLLHGKERLQND